MHANMVHHHSAQTRERERERDRVGGGEGEEYNIYRLYASGKKASGASD